MKLGNPIVTLNGIPLANVVEVEFDIELTPPKRFIQVPFVEPRELDTRRIAAED